MLIYPPGASQPLRGDLVVRVVIRSDLVPIPQTVELEVRDLPETESLQIGAQCVIGHHGFLFKLVADAGTPMPGYVQNSRQTGTKTLIGVLASLEPLINPLQRGVVSYQTSLGQIYTACGGRVPLGADVPVPVFVSMKGSTPTFEIAKALHEAAAAPVLNEYGVLGFERIGEMARKTPVREVRLDSTEYRESLVVERQMVPYVVSTDVAGQVIQGRAESGRGVAYRASAAPDILSNLSSYLVIRRKMQSIYSPDILAGDVIKVGGTPLTVVTAAHVMQVGGEGAAEEQHTTMWLGEAVVA